MKFTIFYKLMILILSFLVLFSSCKEEEDAFVPITEPPAIKPDSLGPVIGILGPSPYNLTLNERYTEHGFTVSDNECDSIDLLIETDNYIDTLEAPDGYFHFSGSDSVFMGIGATISTGVFEVKYSATDTSGNKSYAIREVNIKNGMDPFALSYEVEKECTSEPLIDSGQYIQEVLADESVNNRIWVKHFLNLEFFNLIVYMDVRNDSIFIPYQIFPEQIAYVVEGKDEANNGFAGILDRVNTSFFIEVDVVNLVYGARSYKLTFTQQERVSNFQ